MSVQVKKYSSKRGACIYEEHWKLIKNNPNKTVTFSLEPILHDKLQTAIKNAKHQDIELRKSSPSSRLYFLRKGNLFKVTLSTSGKKPILL